MSIKVLTDAKRAIVLPFPTRSVRQPEPRKARAARWIRFQLWFNTYRCVEINKRDRSLSLTIIFSKFFTFVLTMNLIGMVLAADGRWSYPRRYSAGCVLGNLLAAILVRNELFGRCLYLTVNTLFAKVSFHTLYTPYTILMPLPVDSSSSSPCLHFCTPASWRYTFWMRIIRIPLVDISHGHHLGPLHGIPCLYIGHGCSDACRHLFHYHRCISLGTEHSSQVSNMKYVWNVLYSKQSTSVFERHHRFIGWWVLK
jgi:hypothetical protein